MNSNDVMSRWWRGMRKVVVYASYTFLLCLLSLAITDADARADNSISASFLPFDPLSPSDLLASPRKTFARWHNQEISPDNKPAEIDGHTLNLISPGGYGGEFRAWGGMARQRPLPRAPIASKDWRVIDMMTEVQRAIGMGLDGFAFSIYQLPPKPGWQKLLNMLEAAQRVDADFRVIPYLDVSSLSGSHPTTAQIADAIAGIASHPSLFHYDGRLVLAAGGVSIFGQAYTAELLAALAARGVPVFFVALDPSWSALRSGFHTLADAYGTYGANNPSTAWTMADKTVEAHADGKLFMGTVKPQVFRPRRGWYVEARNSQTLRDNWKVAISSQPDWVLLMNWNDYAEGNQVSPATGTQWAFYDLCAFYNTWYKTGSQPEIKRDVLYYVHRIQSTKTMPDWTQQPHLIEPKEANPEAARDNIEMLAFLTQDGTLEIGIGETVNHKWFPAGITSYKVPLANGIPHFRLLRAGKTVIDMTSAFEIRDSIVYQDLLYRAGSSTREPVEMVANPPIP